MSVNGEYISEQDQQTGPAPATARMYLEVSPFNSDLSQGHGRYMEMSEFLQADNNLSELANKATARQNLDLEIGVDVQAWSGNLDTLAALDDSDGNFIVGSAGGWVAESGATVRASLGLGTIATVNSPVPIANGGSGQTTQQAAIDALTAVSAATTGHVLTKDGSGNATFQAAAASLTIEEADGSPSVSNVSTIVVSNGTLTDDGGGQVTITTGGGGGASLPVADTTAIVKGSVDATKLLRFEVDGFTTGTTRVLTPPDQDGTIAVLERAQTFTAAQTIGVSSSSVVELLLQGPSGGQTSNYFECRRGAGILDFYIESAGQLRLGRFANLASPAPSGVLFTAGNNNSTASAIFLCAGSNTDAAQFTARKSRGAVNAPAIVQAGDSLGIFTFQGYDGNFYQETAQIHVRATGTPAANSVPSFITFETTESVNRAERMRVAHNGRIGINETTPLAQLHVDQTSTTAAIPTLRLQQADLSEEFIRFDTTVGTGNPIEAVGAKTLTTTHFIRVHIEGVGARYVPVGTIA